MPQGEKFWNPYRWIEVSNEPIQHARPLYHHRFDGLSGRIACTLEALTPLIVGGGRGQFVTHKRNGRPYIPATSLKGTIRSLAELVGNAAVPFSNVSVDDAHELNHARIKSGGVTEYDIVARTFGFLNRGEVFAGLIQFSDGEVLGDAKPNQWPQHTVAVGQPKPSHRPFYPDQKRRKAYHHTPCAERLTGPHAGITQTANTRPAPCGTQFTFTVDFRNLRDDELNLLLYCLVLEEHVSVTLSKDALGLDHETAGRNSDITGPMRHKVGGCKPHGGGSACIQVTRLTIRTDPAERYRGRDTSRILETEALTDEIQRRIASFVGRTDKTMQQLRAMMIYTAEDPRGPINYPTFQWFQEDKERPVSDKRPLKPTI